MSSLQFDMRVKSGRICNVQHSFKSFKITSFNRFSREAVPAIYCSVRESVIQRIILEHLLLYLQSVATGFMRYRQDLENF